MLVILIHSLPVYIPSDSKVEFVPMPMFSRTAILVKGKVLVCKKESSLSITHADNKIQIIPYE